MGQPTKGTKQFGGEIDEALVERWRAFCAERREKYGESAREHLEAAMERHLANPSGPRPKLEPEPLPPHTLGAPPDVPAPAPRAAKKRGRPKPKGGAS